MKKFEEFIAESLAAEIKNEPKTAASRQAKQLGLKYAGFGRYADKKGNIAYLVHDDKLVPYKRRDDVSSMYSKVLDMPDTPKPLTAKKGIQAKPDKKELAQKNIKFYGGVLSKREKADMETLRQKTKEAAKYKESLYNFYSRKNFSQEEQAALEWYTGDGYQYINKYLYKGHDEGASYQDDVTVKKAIKNLDSAFEDMEAPFRYTVYTGLSSRYKSDKFKPGSEYVFRGYVSTSLDYETAIDGFSQIGFNDNAVILQVEIKKGQKSIFVDGISANSGEGETLLPRGSRIKVISGPHPVEKSLVSLHYDEGHVHLFHCEIVEDK